MSNGNSQTVYAGNPDDPDSWVLTLENNASGVQVGMTEDGISATVDQAQSGVAQGETNPVNPAVNQKLNICQGTLYKLGCKIYEAGGGVPGNGSSPPVRDVQREEPKTRAAGDQSKRTSAEATSERYVPSVPLQNAESTSVLGDVSEQFNTIREDFLETFSNIDFRIDYERTEKGAKVRVFSRTPDRESTEPASGPDVAEPTGAPDDETQPEAVPPEQVVPTQFREIANRTVDTSNVTVSIRPNQRAEATANGDTGAGGVSVNNEAEIEKRIYALMVNDIGNIQLAVNLGLTVNFLVGVETD